ncbi:hypothetical protein [Conexibacter woesei]|uniref:REDY-like protein HapK n=1 Tax=Conexibacter woesei (strain DSM 14684 / CCUG 47730 / CIP 108061 / JCM 11494 / NBRC 100937 / ID131577) TaxID=469383 RepID=D3F2K2_CONWI|nr:hypothetical protein [Conexibacter woesei]ADB52268.1 hypothetical protein Cwoe_3851 [Conexibacter woesei DSM 14684]
MAQEIVILLTLGADVDVAEYERWVREVDYPLTRRQPGVLSYTVTRLNDATEGAGPVPAQYVEVIRVEDAAEYQRRSAETDDAEFTAMLARWADYVAWFTASVGVAIE